MEVTSLAEVEVQVLSDRDAVAPSAQSMTPTEDGKAMWDPTGDATTHFMDAASSSAEAGPAGAPASKGAPMAMEPPRRKLRLSSEQPAGPSTPFGITTDCDIALGVRTVDIFVKMRSTENDGRVYNADAKYLQYRRVLVDWMCDAGEWFRLNNSTMHVAVGYLDRILQQVAVAKNRLQLVAICCILIAAKYEEAEEHVPAVPAIMKYANNNYKSQQIHEMEIMVLNRLGWCLTVVTPLHFLGYALAKGVVFTTDRMGTRGLIPKVPKYVKKYVDFFADLCLQDYSFQQYAPSLLAAGIIGASRRALNIRPFWCPALTALLHYSDHEVNECFVHIWEYYLESFPAEGAAADAAAEVSYESPKCVTDL